jgi:hypothetical protein
MSEPSETNSAKDQTAFGREVGAKATRKLGAALGLWLDKHHAGKHSWTLALLVAGLAIGCFNAWHWVSKEDKEMHEEQGKTDD